MEGEELDDASEGHETLVTNEEAPLMNKNTGGMASPVLWAIDDDVSLTTQSLGSSFSPHTRPGKYSVFMAGETSAPTNAEKQAEGENLVENIQDLVKLQNDRINQIATQLQFLIERVTDPNDQPPATPSSLNRRDPHTSGARIDQIAAQIQ
ncbi:hypothetical protein AAC387_Pa12g0666 [Persea americana]